MIKIAKLFGVLFMRLDGIGFIPKVALAIPNPSRLEVFLLVSENRR